MEANEQITRFKEFIDAHYKNKLYELANQGKKSLILDFIELTHFDHELANILLDDPEDTIRSAELSLEQFDLPKNCVLSRIRFRNFPKSQIIRISNVRSEHLGRFLVIEGIVRQASDVRPQVTNAKFECAGCGNNISILQIDTKFKEPSRCTCGWRGKFRLLSKDLIDVQHLKIEEAPESLEGGEQPKRLSVFLKEDLVEPRMEKKTTPGSKINIYGLVKEVPIQLKTGAQSTRYDIMLEANHIEAVQEDFSDILLTPEDEQKILETGKDPLVFEKFAKAIAPSIYGHEKIKQALVLQIMGGVRKKKPDGTTTRGDIHVLLIGDPGSGKSQLLQFMSKAAPKARFISGKGASGAGLTASVVKDDIMKGWSLEAGALVLANKGLCCLHPDTKIIADNKLLSIKELYNKDIEKKSCSKNETVFLHNINCETTSINLENMETFNTKATKIRRKWNKEELLEIKFDSGFKILLTQDHKLVNGSSLEWKEASEFKVGNSVLAPLKLDLKNKELLIIDVLSENWKVGLNYEEKEEIKHVILSRYHNLSEFNKKFSLDKNYLSGGKQLVISKFKEILKDLNLYEKWKVKNLKFIRSKNGESLLINKVTPELCYILGFAFGDGSFGSSKRRSRFSISQSEVHMEFINKINDYSIKVFGKEFNKYKNTRNFKIKNKEFTSTGYLLYHNSNLLCEIMKNIIGDKLENITLLPLDCFKAFIGGIIDSDGCPSDNKSKKMNKEYITQHITIKISNDEQTNLNLILALRRFDIYSKLKRYSKGVLDIEITGRKDVHGLLSSIIGYSLKAEKKKLIYRNNMISSTSDKLPKELISILMKKIFSLNKSMLLKEGIWSIIYNYRYMKIQPSRDQLNKILIKLEDWISAEDKILMNNLLKRDFFIDKIREIKKVDYEGYVYDLFIPETHNFLADGIIVHNCVDELDKIDPEDTAALHSAMEQQIIPISKANVQATLSAETTLLAAANPKLGRFDPYTPIPNQIDLPSTLINRFDLIFPVRDIPNIEKDERIALHVLETSNKEETYKTDISVEFLRKYIAYAKQKIQPKLTKAAINEIKNYYVNLRNPKGMKEDSVKPIPISARQLEGLIRLTEASARLRLDEKATKEDAVRAIELLNDCLMEVGFDKETGQIDMDRITTGITASARGRIIGIKEIINNLDSSGLKMIPFDTLMTEALSKGIAESKVDEALDQLKKSGEIFEPKKGFISKVG